MSLLPFRFLLLSLLFYLSWLVGWSYIYPKVGTVKSFPQKDEKSGTVPNLPGYCIHWQTFLEVGKFLTTNLK